MVEGSGRYNQEITMTLRNTCLTKAAGSLAGILLMMAFTTPAFAQVDNRGVLRTSSGQIVVNSFDNCVRTRWMSDHDACGPQQRMAKRRLQIAKEDRTVYFGFNKASLTPEMATRRHTLPNTL